MIRIFSPRRITPLACFALLGFVGCGDSPADPDADTSFVVDVVGERFVVRATDADAGAALQAMRTSGANRVISGRVVAGDGGFNAPWNWHLDPETVHVADFAIEVCDGRPSDVEGDLPYWTDTVKQYCPWSSRVVGTK